MRLNAGTLSLLAGFAINCTTLAARYTSAGQLDTSFGSQSDGKIVAAGNSGDSVQQSFVNNIAVARYLAH